MTPAVEVAGLVKTYGDFTAVSGIDFTVAPGEIFGFLGPNGAGKSTTIRMLCTLSLPTAGTARVCGHDVVSGADGVRRSIGLVFQDQTLDDQLTAEENLRFHASLYGMPAGSVEPRLARLLDVVGLTSRRRDVVQKFSGGMARRLEIARGLLHAPRVLFLDEPTVGLDPQTRARIWDDVRRLRDDEGVTVFLTTHYMDEAEYADRIAIIDHGRIVACDTPAALKASVSSDVVELETADDEAAALALVAAGATARRVNGGVRVDVHDASSAVPWVIGRLDVPVHQVRLLRPTLDDVFLHYTGHEIRDGSASGNSALRRFMSARRR